MGGTFCSSKLQAKQLRHDVIMACNYSGIVQKAEHNLEYNHCATEVMNCTLSSLHFKK